MSETVGKTPTKKHAAQANLCALCGIEALEPMVTNTDIQHNWWYLATDPPGENIGMNTETMTYGTV
ncbi:hypothetical protein [Phaeobacter sp. HF9A]|uniref:hypothetical protein n=1 Tax=Phaeobacter sp. HF9A TaxID=2721561 RepID=UPI0014309196|nr:hypothetical protein [Phaeobacter sp. HF9A]NIZ15269.1 hypothetical protein [Phaeobacter sp. HF9A]